MIPHRDLNSGDSILFAQIERSFFPGPSHFAKMPQSISKGTGEIVGRVSDLEGAFNFGASGCTGELSARGEKQPYRKYWSRV